MAKPDTSLLNKQLPLFSATIMNGPTGPERLNSIKAQIKKCHECNLCEQRGQAIPGDGNALKPILAIVTGAPDVTEDLSGVPIVGRPGVILDEILTWMGLPRENQFLCHVVACKPKSRVPNQDQVAACRPLVYAQLRAVLPMYIITFGEDAARSVRYEPKRTDKQIQAGYGVWGNFDTTPVMSTHSLESMLGANFRAIKGDTHEHLRRVVRKLREAGILQAKEG